MKSLEDMTMQERSLMLYFETCAVDLSGRVDARRMNDDDFAIARRWDKEGFIRFGRICSANHNSQGQHWCEPSHEAWHLAHQERRLRAERSIRRYERTCDR